MFTHTCKFASHFGILPRAAGHVVAGNAQFDLAGGGGIEPYTSS